MVTQIIFKLQMVYQESPLLSIIMFQKDLKVLLYLKEQELFIEKLMTVKNMLEN